VLTLNRPAARKQPLRGLNRRTDGALKEIHDDRDVRAVVIAANGPAFSAGHDMKESPRGAAIAIADAPISRRS